MYTSNYERMIMRKFFRKERKWIRITDLQNPRNLLELKHKFISFLAVNNYGHCGISRRFLNALDEEISNVERKPIKKIHMLRHTNNAVIYEWMKNSFNKK